MTWVPPVCKLWRRDQWSAFRIQRSAMIPVRFVVARSWDGLLVHDLDLLVDYPSPEVISRQTCPAEAFLTAGDL